jgi:hypothetical protein
VKVTRNLPPSVEQQQTLLGVSIGGSIFCHNAIRHLTPNLAVSIRLTKDISLIVRIVVDKDSSGTTEKEGDGSRKTPFGAVFDEVKRVGCVHGWHPHKATPAEVIAGPVMLNIHAAHVA